MQDSVKGKTVLITGGSRGIGQCISELFASKGARIYNIYRSDEASANKVINSLPGEGHKSFKLDISQPSEIENLFYQLTGEKIDILINNAGIGYHHPIEKVDFDEWQKGWDHIIKTNLIAPSNMSYHVAQKMIQNGGGKIINVSSRGAFRGEPEQPAYGASKAGLNALTQSLAYQLAPYSIFVGAVAPGFVETDMSRPRLEGEVGKAIAAQSPMNRVAQPEEVAQAIYLMASGNMWMTGAIIDVNGGSYMRT